MQRLRDRRRFRRVMQDLDSGLWRKVLLDAERTQHKYRPSMRDNGDIAALLVKVNLVSLALDLHADVIAGNPARVTVAQDFADQKLAVDRIRRAGLFDTTLHRACRRLYKEAESALRVTTDRNGQTVICLDSNSQTIPVGPRGADGQPEYWERRWIIERPPVNSSNAAPDRFLRVERHRAGVIEQEAYRVDGTGVADVLIDLDPTQKVALAIALGMGEGETGIPEPITRTGVPYPLVVSLYSGDEDGEPGFLLRDGDLDILDMATAAVSRLSREHEQHAGATLSVEEQAVDQTLGALDLSKGAILGKASYVVKDLKLEQMLGFMDRALTLLMTVLRVSPALLGARLGGGSTPDTYDKLRLEATQTLTRGRTTIRYIEPALERIFEVASMFDAARSFAGYPVAPVSVSMRAEIPKDTIDKAREQAELKREGLTSEYRAIVEIHGEDIAPQVQEEINADRARIAEAGRSALFDAVPPVELDPIGAGGEL